MGEEMATVSLPVTGMPCAAYARRVEKALSKARVTTGRRSGRPVSASWG